MVAAYQGSPKARKKLNWNDASSQGYMHVIRDPEEMKLMKEQLQAKKEQILNMEQWRKRKRPSADGLNSFLLSKSNMS